jgi:hypothetical protein
MRRMLLFLLMPVVFITSTFAQPSTLPPSSLPVLPLSPGTTSSTEIGSCDLCRPLEGRRGSDLTRHRRPRDPQLHPHKKAPRVSRSPKQSFKSQLPHHKLGENQEGAER